MASAFRNFTRILEETLTNGEDPRTTNWLFMSSPYPALGLVLSYIYFVKVLGPALMKDRKPFDLKIPMFLYNVAMVLLNLWLWIEGGRVAWFGKYKLFCQPVDFSYSPDALRIAELGWYFMMSRFLEFIDTLFFILRKKFNCVSALHVIHHSSVPLNIWLGTKYSPGGHMSFFPFMNAFVHIIMYSYYALAALGPKFRPYLWWKKYMTTLQMAQFAIAFFHGLAAIIMDCKLPRLFTFLTLFNAVLFWVLFHDFYRKSYSQRPKKKEDAPASDNGAAHAPQFAPKHLKHRVAQALSAASEPSLM